MDLNVHRTITYKAFTQYLKASDKKNNKGIIKCFHDIWMGNWLTDMNQATAFFSIVDSFISEQKLDYYKAWDKETHKYILPHTLKKDSFKPHWEKLIETLWEHEWKETKEKQESFDSFHKQNTPLEKGTAQTGKAEEIGCYYPLDHFDVTDSYNGKEWTDNEALDLEWIKNKKSKWSKTAAKGIDYALNSWIHKAFETKPEDRSTNPDALKKLGHGLHILQDFFAHSNYPEVLLLALSQQGHLEEKNPVLSKNLEAHIKHDTPGTFNSFPILEKAIETPILTGRFDTIDTLYTLAGKYKGSLLQTAWNDTEEFSVETYDKEQSRDETLDLLFGTFSSWDQTKPIAKLIDFRNDVDDFFEGVKEVVKGALIRIATWFGKRKAKDDKKKQANIDQIGKIALMLNESDIERKSYSRAGSIMFLEYHIEQFLNAKTEKAEEEAKKAKKGEMCEKYILPHHTLLAKDKVVLNSEVRLAFKIGCTLATQLSEFIMESYFEGKAFSSISEEIRDRLKHPSEIIKNTEKTDHLKSMIDKLYTGRWWQY